MAGFAFEVQSGQLRISGAPSWSTGRWHSM